MKTLRHYFYLTSAVLSGLCLITMTTLILAQITARMFGAGWLLSATIFFGLAYTFNDGGHIRVTILLSRLSEKTLYWLEFVNLSAALFISGYLAYYVTYTAYESYIYHDVTDTYLALPLWAVQAPMALGSVFFMLAIADNFIAALSKRTPDFVSQENALSNAE